MKKYIIFLILFAILFTACKSSNANADAQPTKLIVDTLVPSGTQEDVTSAKGDSSNAKNADARELLADGAVIVIQRSGGIAGLNDQWSFYPDGKIVHVNIKQSNASDTQSVDAVQVTALLAALKAAGFFEMKSASGIGSGLSNCKDCFTYKLTATSEGSTNSISLQDSATGSPSTIEQLIKQIIALAPNQ